MAEFAQGETVAILNEDGSPTGRTGIYIVKSHLDERNNFLHAVNFNHAKTDEFFFKRPLGRIESTE